MRNANTVLIAWLKEVSDLRIALEEGWYRIPVDSAPAIIQDRKARIIAFYQPAVFGEERFRVKHYANIRQIKEVSRAELFPNFDKDPSKADKRYLKIEIEKTEELPQPIVSRRGHRLTFVPTTEKKFFSHTDFNYMFNGSPLEDDLFYALESEGITSERQWCCADKTGHCQYFLDFAIHCRKRNIDVECDGDSWHDLPQRVHYDKARNNDLTSKGWSVLRFTTEDITMRMSVVMNKIKDTLRDCGGIKEMPRINTVKPKPGEQGRLFT